MDVSEGVRSSVVVKATAEVVVGGTTEDVGATDEVLLVEISTAVGTDTELDVAVKKEGSATGPRS